MLMESHVSDIARVIQLAVAPVFLLTAVGTIISALNGRIGRIVDRRRVLDDRLRALPAGEDETTREYLAEMETLARRSRLIYTAMIFAVLSALLVCLLVAGAFLGAFIAIDLSETVGILFVCAMFSLAGALGILLREVFIAVQVSAQGFLLRGGRK
jgi:hypothetical protein